MKPNKQINLDEIRETLENLKGLANVYVNDPDISVQSMAARAAMELSVGTQMEAMLTALQTAKEALEHAKNGFIMERSFDDAVRLQHIQVALSLFTDSEKGEE